MVLPRQQGQLGRGLNHAPFSGEIQYPAEHADRTVDRTHSQPALFLFLIPSAIQQASLLVNGEARHSLIRDFIQLGIRQCLVSGEATDSSAKPEPIVAASSLECRLRPRLESPLTKLSQRGNCPLLADADQALR